jgi:hypothetical protein
MQQFVVCGAKKTPMTKTHSLTHYIKPNGDPTQNLTALMQIAVNQDSSENMKKACSHSFRELSEMIHAKSTTTDSKKRKPESQKQTNNKKECVETNPICQFPVCSSESDSDSDQCIDVASLQIPTQNNPTSDSFFNGGKFK